MDYLKQDTAFEKWCENNYLPIFAYVIWRKLFKRFNRGGWCEWITVDNLTLMAECQMKSEKSLILYRNKMIEAGLIEYIKGGKGNPNKYKMTKLYTVKCTAETTVESAVQPQDKDIDCIKYSTNDTQNAVETTVESTVQSSSLHYNKTKTETKTKTNIGADKPRNTQKFIPPTANEVAAYCLERNNGIDAEHFIAYYAARDWIMNNNKKMANWKSAVITWEKRNNQANNFNKPLPETKSEKSFREIVEEAKERGDI